MSKTIPPKANLKLASFASNNANVTLTKSYMNSVWIVSNPAKTKRCKLNPKSVILMRLYVTPNSCGQALLKCRVNIWISSPRKNSILRLSVLLSQVKIFNQFLECMTGKTRWLCIMSMKLMDLLYSSNTTVWIRGNSKLRHLQDTPSWILQSATPRSSYYSKAPTFWLGCFQTIATNQAKWSWRNGSAWQQMNAGWTAATRASQVFWWIKIN